MHIRRSALVVLCLLSSMMQVALAAPVERFVSVPVASVFRAPSARAERVTQALLGERVSVLKVSGGWAQVRVADQYRLSDGYPGFMLATSLADAPARGTSSVCVKVARAPVRGEARADAPLLHSAFMGTVLPAETPEGAWVRVHLPGRAEAAYVSVTDVSVSGEAALIGGESVVRTALQLRDTPYLWGGLTVVGIDCSGLTFESYRVYGIVLPRDADQQFQTGRAVDRAHLAAGDLVFFGRAPDAIRHVGIYWKDGRFVEATSRGGVRVSALASRDGFQGGRRMLGLRLRMPAPSP